MGEVRVPKSARWRAQTQRAVENFPVSGTRVEQRLIAALAAIKRAAAVVNAELGVVDEDVARLEAAQLDEAIRTKKQPHADEVVRIVSTRSKRQLRATFQRYEQEHGTDIDEVPAVTVS